MDLDLIRKIKFPYLKASFETLALKQKIFLVLFLLSLVLSIIPHKTYAQAQMPRTQAPALIFDTDNLEYQNYLDQIAQELADNYYRQKLQQEAQKQARLAAKVKLYLGAQSSPLAEYAATLVNLRSWKKIVALANAESTLCRRYPASTANCWGVGGEDLWDMGSNLGEGVVSMDHFLNKYPRGSKVKYAQMNFEHMNGLYKQPARQHWVDNNQVIYDQLTAIENSLN